MDILVPKIEAFPTLYANYVEVALPRSFLEVDIECEHNKEWLLEAEKISKSHQDY
jgi:hypothetical protein